MKDSGRDANAVVVMTAAVGAGMMGGLLFAFSDFVMQALSRQPPESSIRTMKAINVEILNPLFVTVFAGTALLTLWLLVASVRRPSRSGRAAMIGGAVFYLAGVIGITMVFNVPLNDHLAAVDPHASNVAQEWSGYLASWLRWNHLRTAAAIASCASLIVAMRQAARPASANPVIGRGRS